MRSILIHYGSVMETIDSQYETRFKKEKGDGPKHHINHAGTQGTGSDKVSGPPCLIPWFPIDPILASFNLLAFPKT
jgi:hypothetical protein